MKTPNMFDKILANATSELVDPEGYVSGRRDIIQEAIRLLSNRGGCSEEVLNQLQDGIENIRVMNASPIDRLRELIPLIEERVTILELAIQEVVRGESRKP